jgi:hypothetical protein
MGADQGAASRALQAAPKCSYAAAGTFGHECGRPAVAAGAKPSDTGVIGRVFWNLRCADCRHLPGRDNWGITHWEPLDAAKHVNRWPDALAARETS